MNRNVCRLAAPLAVASAMAMLLVAGCGGGTSSGGEAGTSTGRTARPSPAIRRERQEMITQRHQVVEAAMVRGESGWARTWNAVFWTADMGHTWRRITPPLRDPRTLRTVWFADPRRGWALAEPGRELHTRPTIYSTVDGGRSWQHVRLRIPRLLLPASKASFAAVGRRVVYVLVKQEGDTASNVGFLLRSDDDGRSWHLLPQPPQAGTISFESRRDGWLAGGYPSPRLWRTVDGGRTWTQVEPPGSGLPRRRSGLGGPNSVSFLPPRLGADGHGALLAVRGLAGVGRTRASIYVTADDGEHWRLAHTVRMPRVGGTLEAIDDFAYLGKGHSLLIHDPTSGEFTPVSADGNPGPTFTAPYISRWASMSFADARHGFALSGYGPRNHLAFTVDGGRNWRPALAPGVKHSWEAIGAAAVPRILPRSNDVLGRQRGGGKGPAGACPAPKGKVAIAYLTDGIAIPRCMLVAPSQRLEIVNATASEGGRPRPETISLAGFHARLAPGEAVLLDEAFGSYLGHGSHYVAVPGGIEVRLDHHARCQAPKPPPCPGFPPR